MGLTRTPRWSQLRVVRAAVERGCLPPGGRGVADDCWLPVCAVVVALHWAWHGPSRLLGCVPCAENVPCPRLPPSSPREAGRPTRRSSGRALRGGPESTRQQGFRGRRHAPDGPVAPTDDCCSRQARQMRETGPRALGQPVGSKLERCPDPGSAEPERTPYARGPGDQAAATYPTPLAPVRGRRASAAVSHLARQTATRRTALCAAIRTSRAIPGPAPHSCRFVARSGVVKRRACPITE